MSEIHQMLARTEKARAHFRKSGPPSHGIAEVNRAAAFILPKYRQKILSTPLLELYKRFESLIEPDK